MIMCLTLMFVYQRSFVENVYGLSHHYENYQEIGL